jgi:hypothetical protein
MAAMIAIEIPAAIRPYSMAVAPDSLFKKAMIFVIVQLYSVLEVGAPRRLFHGF